MGEDPRAPPDPPTCLSAPTKSVQLPGLAWASSSVLARFSSIFQPRWSPRTWHREGPFTELRRAGIGAGVDLDSDPPRGR